MSKWRKADARFFVEDDYVEGGFKYLPSCQVQFVHENEIDMDFGDELPTELDKVLPQVVYLVFQKSDRPHAMFDDTRLGTMLVVSGFTVNYQAPPPMFIRHEDGHIEVPRPEITFSCWDISVVRGDNVELQTC